MESLKRTPLYEDHKKLGARIVPFAGFEMPVQFSSIIEEHNTVRTKVGIFDVSHMGEIWIKGKDALNLVQKISSNNAEKLSKGQIQYSGLLTKKGTFVDDMLVHKIEDEIYFLVVNASNLEKDFNFILENSIGFNAEVLNKSDETAQIAIQGPYAIEVVSKIVKDVDFSTLKYYWFTYCNLYDEKCLIARTGYTGEDGVEIYISPENASKLWNELLSVGKDYGLKPIGLGARDTLRLEASMALYGNDIDDTTTPLEADLSWILKLDKNCDFNGKEILLKQKEEGIKRKLIAFELKEQGIPRHLMDCFKDGEKIGFVTSGTLAPYLKKPIGMAYLKIEHSNVETEFFVDVRGKMLKAVVVNKPFYKRQKK